MTIDLKKSPSLHVVMSGTVEMEGSVRSEVVYLPAGSFFGTLPFCDRKNRGILKAATDASILILDEVELYRYLLSRFRALRGYVRILDRMGFDISDNGREYSGNRTGIIAVCAEQPGAGISLACSLLGLSLSGSDKTIILDLSYDGISLFDNFGQKVVAPLSLRPVEGGIQDELDKRIVQVSGNLHLLNIAWGSRVRVNPDILSPVLVLLSRKYRHIILDVPGGDEELRNRALSLSDTVLFFIRKNGSPSARERICSVLDDGQRIIYVANERLCGRMSGFDGLVMEDYSEKGDITLQVLQELSVSGAMASFIPYITGRRASLVLETRGFDAMWYAGIFRALGELESFESVYSSHWTYCLAALNAISPDYDSFRKAVDEMFSGKRISSLLEPVFPDRFVFKSNPVKRYMEDVFGGGRIEQYRPMPIALLRSVDGETIRTSGYLGETAAASWITVPQCEPVPVRGIPCHSGFPAGRVQPQDLLRTDVDRIVMAVIGGDAALPLPAGRIPGFYRQNADSMNSHYPQRDNHNLADRILTMAADSSAGNMKKIVDYSEKEWLKLFNMKDSS